MVRISKLTAFSATVTFFGTLAVLRKVQELRFFKKDSLDILKQEAEIRDVGKLIDKYGITEQELDRIKEENELEAKMFAAPPSVVDINPNWENKRVPRNDARI
ncbi:uncharacterized protein LOC127872923 [Dreissena polymorpha]|uniref:Uncharacterized protein n=1 Tax=Dreissena polymorpha TaxID=45954 RepID=A0A9D4LA12_DREPO|nr:uncharacterized protein LOC127872923 [Dreissena polymorpha]KAH3854737.1 hypothetical protein DPMN_097286 [Dreissena polymorpha]